MDLGRDLVARLDQGDMLGALASLPDQLTTAYATARGCLADAESRQRPGRPVPPASPTGVAVCGMGGSAIGGDLALASLPELAVPTAVVRGYAPPGWVGPQTLVVAVSYSGDTEETLACTAAALERGCAPVCIASGGRLASLAAEQGLPLVTVPAGLQPRAALGLLAASLLAVLEATGLCGPQRAAVDEAAALLRRGTAELGPDAPEAAVVAGESPDLPGRALAKGLARVLHGAQVVVYGGGSTVAVARRWKAQINENAKAPAFWNEVPELDHNEIMGWSSLPAISRATTAVFLNDGELDERLVLRAELTARVLAERGVVVQHVWAHGASRLARLLSLVQLGDYTSFYLALLYGVDPSPVAAIQEFKAKLATAG